MKQLLLGGLSYFLLAEFSILCFAAEPANIALLWLPAGLGPYLYNRWGASMLVPIFVASFSANFAGMAVDSLWLQCLHTAINASADTLFAYIAGEQLQRYLPRGLDRPKDQLTFLVHCGLLPLTVSTAIIGANLWLGGYLSLPQATTTGLAIFISDLLGLLLIYPLFPAWQRRHNEAIGSVTPIWWFSSLAAVGFVISSFFVAPWLLYFALPTLIYAVFGANTLYAFSSLTICIILYNVLATLLLEFPTIDDARLGVQSLSLSVTVAILALAIQQRNLLAERASRDKWKKSANHDALTGLANRGHIRYRIEQEIERLESHGGMFCLAVLDIDHFKSVNDTFGHTAGDQVLVEITRRLGDALRQSDVVARYGGEEFLILLLNTSIAGASHKVDKIRQQIASEPFVVGTKSINLTFSAGVAEYQRGSNDTVDKLVNLADKRMYLAKRQGRNRVVA